MMQETLRSPGGLFKYSPYVDFTFVSLRFFMYDQLVDLWYHSAPTFAEEEQRIGCCLILGLNGFLSIYGVYSTPHGQYLQQGRCLNLDIFRYGREFLEIKKEPK